MGTTRNIPLKLDQIQIAGIIYVLYDQTTTKLKNVAENHNSHSVL